jgi:hypothetical protein
MIYIKTKIELRLGKRFWLGMYRCHMLQTTVYTSDASRIHACLDAKFQPNPNPLADFLLTGPAFMINQLMDIFGEIASLTLLHW